MKKLLSLLLLPFGVIAAGQVDYLNVDGDVVYFSTSESKSSSLPACVVSATQEQFSVSLNKESGRAIYSLLITAMASKEDVTVASAQDCGDITGIERAKSVSIAPKIQQEQTDKLKWAGYTHPVAGNFAFGSSPFVAGSNLCNTQFPGARMMLWNDYVQLAHNYPDEHSIWFIDAIESHSHMAKSSNTGTHSLANVLYKNGQILSSYVDGFDAGFKRGMGGNLSCSNWTTSNGRFGYTGTAMYVNGRFGTTSCSSAVRLACVK